ncbi:hypothetical protein [Amycolatopsis sp. lyj-90]|uniref:hypothetical protein n=1 Tax=Amycolatopsis sp. lyj-90 TaxID=2789285 RepID=UPI00397C8146
MGRVDEFRRRASDKPCPWCERAEGFDKPSLQERIKIEGRDAASGAVTGLTTSGLGSFLRHLAKPKGVDAVCARCRAAVKICPRCDSPNRPGGMIEECTACGNTFV